MFQSRVFDYFILIEDLFFNIFLVSSIRSNFTKMDVIKVMRVCFFVFLYRVSADNMFELNCGLSINCSFST